MKHTKNGNCWDKTLVYSCEPCGKGNLCDVCHEHDEPRFACHSCARCRECDADTEGYEGSPPEGTAP